MKKNVFNLWIFAALVCGLSLSVTSCKDDDDNEPSPEEQEQQALEQAEKEMMAFNVLDYLADMSNAPEDYLTGSYEPTIGVADGGNTSTRIVNTNDMATAALRFADMVGASIDENTSEYIWSDDKVGTLTYTKTNDGKSWATVDVSIKQIPHLSKIIYRSPAQADNNGKFKGTAYYRFGDVVKKKNADGEDEFWICVRPAFGPEGKETSHWVTVCPLPKANLFTYKASNGIDYALPTKLGDNHEQSKNFAEMLFAIFFPKEWENNIINTKGISMFHDFEKENLMYHRQAFWTRVQKAWTDPNALTNANGNPSGISLLKSLFGTDGTPEYFKTMLKSADGLNLLTNGYSWNTTFSNKPTLYRYRFVNGTGTESNMHMEPIKHDFLKNYHSVTAEVIKAKITLNCIKDYSTVTPGWKVSNFFGTENKHYIIRHATGAELSTDKKEDAKKPLTGVTEVYRYNKYYGITNLDVTPEIAENYEEHGAIAPGTILKDEEGCHWVCYSAWGDYEGIFTTADHKARFFSLDRLSESVEGIYNVRKNWEEPDKGSFTNNEDLLPESEAPALAIFLTFISASNADAENPPIVKLREQIHSAFNINLRDWQTHRDSTLSYNGGQFPGDLYSFNVAYMPANGRKKGTQPYLRFVLDNSGMGSNRSNLPNWLQYPRLRFFKKYNDGSNLTLDLTHTYKSSGFITADKYVKADEFSRAKRVNTGLRDGDFTVKDVIDQDFTSGDFNKYPKVFGTPYREKVLVVRYLELEDPTGNGQMKSEYGGKKYTVVYSPTEGDLAVLRIQGMGQAFLARGHNPGSYNWCTMDGKKYELNYFTECSTWPLATDGE